MVLTDQGNVHLYYLFGDSEQLHGMEGNYRGTIRATKGSISIQQDATGLYLAVISPLSNMMSFDLCKFEEQAENFLEF